MDTSPLYRLGGHLNGWLGGRDNNQFSRATTTQYFVLTGRKKLSFSPGLDLSELGPTRAVPFDKESMNDLLSKSLDLATATEPSWQLLECVDLMPSPTAQVAQGEI